MAAIILLLPVWLAYELVRLWRAVHRYKAYGNRDSVPGEQSGVNLTEIYSELVIRALTSLFIVGLLVWFRVKINL